MSDERIQQTIEEREAKTTAALRQKKRAEGIAKKWGLPWPEPSRKGQWGRMSREFRMKRELYAKIQRIVEGKEPEPASPQLPVGYALGAKGSTQAEGHEVNEGNVGEGNVDKDNGGEGNGGEGNGGEGNGSEGNGGEGNGSEGNGGEGNGSEGNGSEGNGGEGNGGEGNGSEGNGSEGNGGEGNGSEGNGSEGNGGEGNGSEGNGGEGIILFIASFPEVINQRRVWLGNGEYAQRILSQWQTPHLFHCLHMEETAGEKRDPPNR